MLSRGAGRENWLPDWLPRGPLSPWPGLNGLPLAAETVTGLLPGGRSPSPPCRKEGGRSPSRLRAISKGLNGLPASRPPVESRICCDMSFAAAGAEARLDEGRLGTGDGLFEGEATPCCGLPARKSVTI